MVRDELDKASPLSSMLIILMMEELSKVVDRAAVGAYMSVFSQRLMDIVL